MNLSKFIKNNKNKKKDLVLSHEDKMYLNNKIKTLHISFLKYCSKNDLKIRSRIIKKNIIQYNISNNKIKEVVFIINIKSRQVRIVRKESKRIKKYNSLIKFKQNNYYSNKII